MSLRGEGDSGSRDRKAVRRYAAAAAAEAAVAADDELALWKMVLLGIEPESTRHSSMDCSLLKMMNRTFGDSNVAVAVVGYTLLGGTHNQQGCRLGSRKVDR